MEKYTPTTKNRGTYHFAGQEIEMSRAVANNKEARISYLMGHLAARGNEELTRYEARREKYGLPIEPFNAAWRKQAKQDGFPCERWPTPTDPNYWKGEDKSDLSEIIENGSKNWSLVSEYFEQMAEYEI